MLDQRNTKKMHWKEGNDKSKGLAPGRAAALKTKGVGEKIGGSSIRDICIGVNVPGKTSL
jgi:hypothetical protein